MAGRAVLAAFISAILVFAWGFLYWGVFNVGGKIMDRVPLADETSDEMAKMFPGDGMYVFPFPESATNQPGQIAFKAKHERGPLYRISYRRDGGPVMPASTMVKGFLLNFVIALLAAGLVLMAGAGLATFDKRLTFVLLISLLSTVWANVGDVIWWFHTPAFCIGNIAYGLVSGLIMGAVIGTLVAPPSAASEAPADAAE